MSAHVFVYVTAPDVETARKLARAVIGERLAACANILSGMRSIYCWNDAIKEEEESVLVLKTRTELFLPLADKIKRLHPYETPCIVALPLTDGTPDFLDWIDRSIGV